MGGNVVIFRAPAFLDNLFHFVLVVEVESNGSIDLVQAQSWIVRLDRSGVFAITVVPNDAVNRHTASHYIEAGFAPPDVIASHDDAQSTRSRCIAKNGLFANTSELGVYPIVID